VKLFSVTTVVQVCPAGQMHVWATGSIAKSSLTKKGLSGRSGTLAISVRSASANACRVAPSPYAQSPMLSSTTTWAFSSLSATNARASVLSGAFPANTVAAVINGLSGSTATAALCPSKRLLALLRP